MLALRPRVVDIISQAIEPRLPEVVDEHPLGCHRPRRDDRLIGFDLSEVSIDGSQHKAPFGGEGTGPNPTDRRKSGWKWSIATDRAGMPIG